MHDPNELQAALDQAKFLMQVACYLIPAAFAGMAWLAIWSRRDS